MSTTQYIIDASTRHQVFLQRYAGGQSKEAFKTLDRLRKQINARLSQEPTEFQAQRLSALLSDIEQIMRDGMPSMYRDVIMGANDLAGTEAGFSVRLYNKVAKVEFALPSDQMLISAVSAIPMAAPTGAASITIDQALSQYGAKKSAEIARTISDGVALGDTTPQIASSVAELMGNLQKQQLDTLVRTITNHTASVARNEVYEANSAFLDGYRWISTLDGRTTFICASRDNNLYQVGLGPMPPAHWGCRSTTIPVVSDEFGIGAKVTGKRASVGGPVDSRITYGGWLKRQPKEFIDEALGVERSKMFRAGKLKIEQFVDPTGRVYTINELERMNPFAFQEV